MKVLVVTPTYGRLPFLGRMLASFLSQTYENKELVIINDDKNVQIACDYPNVICINVDKKMLIGQKKNLATNFGYHDLYIPFDDDDIILPNKIQNHVNKHLEFPDIDLYRNLVSYSIYGSDFLIAGSTINAVSYTRKGWFKCNGYQHPINCGEDQSFENSIVNRKWLEDYKNIDYVYNFGGINYHLSSTSDDTIEQIAYNQLKEMNMIGNKFVIKPDFEEYDKFVELDRMYKQNKETIKVKHTGLAKLEIIK